LDIAGPTGCSKRGLQIEFVIDLIASRTKMTKQWKTRLKHKECQQIRSHEVTVMTGNWSSRDWSIRTMGAIRWETRGMWPSMSSPRFSLQVLYVKRFQK